MSLSLIRMRGECLVIASLQGFSDASLRMEMRRRSHLRTQFPLNSTHVRADLAAQHSQEMVRGGKAELHEVLSLSEFDTAALVDELQTRPNFNLMLRDQFGLSVVSIGEAFPPGHIDIQLL